MASVLPLVPANPLYEFASPIDGLAYWFRIRWNSREEVWHMDVFEEDKTTVIIAGVAILLGVYLGRASAHTLFMNNIIVARAPKGDKREATFDDMGTRVQVHVFSRDEAAAEIMGSIGENAR